MLVQLNLHLGLQLQQLKVLPQNRILFDLWNGDITDDSDDQQLCSPLCYHLLSAQHIDANSIP